MIERVTGNKSLPESIRRDIIERTDGIPLFVEEITKQVANDHQPCCDADARLEGRVGLQIGYGSDQLQSCAHGSLCVVFMRLGVAEVDQHPVAHELRDETAETPHGLGHALLVGRDDLAEVFRVHAGESAVEPTRSENITVTWRRSAVSLGALAGVGGSVRPPFAPFSSPLSWAIARNSWRRCPSDPIPSSLRS
jgi:hypothetical protein